MIQKIVAIVGFFCIGSCFAQTPVILNPVGSFPSSCFETSGLALSSNGKLWNINDSGNLAELYQIDSQANVTKTLVVNGTTNVDWEDLTRSSDGRLFIGDMGNNANLRTDLCIYILPNPDTVTGSSIDTLGKIQFSYPDQTAFPPEEADMNFDCESMFWWNNHIYLVSKNRGSTQFAKLYQLPDQPGTYIPSLLDSFNTSFWITGADISPNGDRLVLESYMGFWIFDNITNGQFFQGTPHQFSTNFTQKEGVVFASNSKLYFSNEYISANQSGGKLYSLEIDSLLNQITPILGTSDYLKTWYSFETNDIWIEIKSTETNKPCKATLFNSAGQLVGEKSFFANNGRQFLNVYLPGLYILDLVWSNQNYRQKFLTD